MAIFSIPTRDEVSENNQILFDNLKDSIGFVPNLYAYIAINNYALEDYLKFKNRKITLNAKEREVIYLVTSQINGSIYCQSVHTLIGKMNGFTNEQIIELRAGESSFDPRLDALVRITSSIVTNKGKANRASIEAFFRAGYTEVNLIDVIVLIGDKIISNYIYNLVGFEVDFPLVTKLPK